MYKIVPPKFLNIHAYIKHPINVGSLQPHFITPPPPPPPPLGISGSAIVYSCIDYSVTHKQPVALCEKIPILVEHT